LAFERVEADWCHKDCGTQARGQDRFTAASHDGVSSEQLARVKPKGNAIVITKQASGSAKIDPLMAAFNAIALVVRTRWLGQHN
jgi:hypothetical protein